MTTARTKVGHGLAKFFNIELQKPQPYEDEVTRGESVNSTDTFVEQPPSAGEYFRELAPSGRDVLGYIKSLFPFLYWIGKYNMQWFAGDLVAGKSVPVPSLRHTLLTRAGITIGAVVVPQGMGYASLANLDPQFGLYSSFMGVLIYWFFATSKDITIGVSIESGLTREVQDTDFASLSPSCLK